MFRHVDELNVSDVRWLWLACRLAQDLWDDELWHELATRGVRVARDTGALTLLPGMSNFLAALNIHSGSVDTATELIEEVGALTEATGIPSDSTNTGHMYLAAIRTASRSRGCVR